MTKLASIQKASRLWASRTGVRDSVHATIDEYLRSAFLSGYMQALIDHDLPTGDLAAEIEEAAEIEDRKLTEGRR